MKKGGVSVGLSYFATLAPTTVVTTLAIITI